MDHRVKKRRREVDIRVKKDFKKNQSEQHVKEKSVITARQRMSNLFFDENEQSIAFP